MKLITFYKSGPNGREIIKEFDNNATLPLKGEEVKFDGDDKTYGVVKITNIYDKKGECRLEYELIEGEAEL